MRFTLGEAWKIPTLDQFIESLVHEQYKLVSMGTIKGPNEHELAMHEDNNTSNPNTKHKRKGKTHSEPKKEETPNPLMIPLDPKVEKERKES